MYIFFLSNDLFSASQFGFQKNRNWVHAICEVTDYIEEKIDIRSHCNACFIDIKKGSHTLDHKILLHKSATYGFWGPIFKLMRNYLTYRWQYVTYDGKISSKRSIQTGVPQGSMLQPFLTKTNNLPLISSNSDKPLFTYHMNKNSGSEITKDIQAMTAWFDKNKLSVKYKNCELTGFRDAKPVNEIAIDVKVADSNFCEYQHMGVYFNKNLNLKEHIVFVTKKLNKCCRQNTGSDICTLVSVFHCFTILLQN